MQGTGKVTLKSSDSNRSYYVVWNSSPGSFERIDVFSNPSDYNSIDTSSCDASYIRSNSEKIYGSQDLIKSILRIKHESSIMHTSEKTSVDTTNGKLRLVRFKELPDLGLFYKVVLEKAKIIEEYYETPAGTIHITEIDSNNNTVVTPINISNYSEYGSASITKKSSGDFYSYEDLLRMYPQVKHVLEEDYVVARSLEEAEERLQQWIESKEQLKSVDIESLHEKWGIFSDNKITGVFLGFGEHWSTYFPFRQDNFKYNLPMEFLRKIFDAVNNQPPYPEVIILSHNAKFELEGFYQEFREWLRVDVDTYLYAVIANPNVTKGSHTLKTLASEVDSRFYLELKHIFIGKIMFNVLTEDIVLLYGCPDATSPAKVYKNLIKKIPADEHFVCRLEMDILRVKCLNEFYGMRMDLERINRLIDEEEFKINLLGDQFRRIHKTSKNINSYPVLKEILYDKLRCPVLVTTDKGLPATSKVAIKTIVDSGVKREYDKDKMPKPILDKNKEVLISSEELAGNKYPSLIIYQKYKKCLKELGALRRLRNKSIRDRFMFYINQAGAGSNRQTSDAHQFSSTMKSCSLADSKYHGQVSCDWKQVELRVLAWMAEQKDLIELECDPAVDIHRAILSIIQKKPMWMISEEDRQAGKGVNFGVVYMMSEYGLAARDFGPGYTKEELNIERKKIYDFFNGLPLIKLFLANNELNLKRNGYIKTKFNYYRYFPELLDPTYPEKLKKTLIRSGNNTPVQGTAAQMLKMVEKNVQEYIERKGWDKEKNYDGVWLPMVRMILPIHDEILLSYDLSIPKEEICLMFKECMELDFEGAPPFFAAPAFIDNWYQGKDPAYEVDIEFRDKVVEEYKKGNYLLTGKDYLKTLNEFRTNEISNYMNSLISKYKTPEEVAKHVNDDNLTHTLIETMIKKEERKKLSHIERIERATQNYFDSLEKKGKLDVVLHEEDEKEEDDSFMDLDVWVDTYSHIDQNGDLIIEDEEEWNEESNSIVHELGPIETRVMNKPHVLYLMQEAWVDLTGLDIETTGEEIYQGLRKLHDPNEFYEVVLVIGKNTFRTGIKVGYISEEIEKLFKKGD